MTLNNDTHQRETLSERPIRLPLNGMARNKSPGYDGITAGFYRKYWHKVGQLVIKTFNDSYNAGRLTPVQNHGIISLLHKGKGLPW